MALFAGTETRLLVDRKRVPGGAGAYKEIWDGDGEYHAVEVSNPDIDPRWSGTSQSFALCGLEVWVLRRDWVEATRHGERCGCCEQRSGLD